jgi:peptidoglycan/xylan/chitin deacetylase (PgdA/CDA1 family)
MHMTANYPVRIDDLCPTMNWDVWQGVEAILLRWGIKPLLAVIPDNQDDFLKRCSPEKTFWEQVRVWRNRGWTIGLHGYQHRYVTQDPGIIGINNSSEFAGLPTEVQAAKLQMAFEIFRREGIRPDVWIAPAHSFDRTTLELLKGMGLRRISDGFFLFPNLDSAGMLWIPQQFWRFRPMPLGVWSVCLHINGWRSRDVLRFQQDVERYRGKIISFEDVVTNYGYRRLDWKDKLFEVAYPQFLRMRLMLRGSWKQMLTGSMP